MGKLKDFFSGKDAEPERPEDEFYQEHDEKGNIIDESNSMILLEPRAYSEAQQIADYLKRRNSVVVNFKRVTGAQAQKIIDFLSGCIYAIGGTMQQLGIGIYLCTPNNISVQGKISQDKDEKTPTKASKDSDQDW